MNESERLQRLKLSKHYDESLDRNVEKDDQQLAERIAGLLNHPQIDERCMVDAYYYDFSDVPWDKQDELNLWRDSYLIFGITTEGDMVSKWVDRWDLDSEDPIVDGKVMKSDKPLDDLPIPEINQYYDAKLLSAPASEFLIKMFGSEVAPAPVDNIIDVKAMDLCEDCKSKMLAEFMKACKGSYEVIKEPIKEGVEAQSHLEKMQNE